MHKLPPLSDLHHILNIAVIHPAVERGNHLWTDLKLNTYIHVHTAYQVMNTLLSRINEKEYRIVNTFKNYIVPMVTVWNQLYDEFQEFPWKEFEMYDLEVSWDPYNYEVGLVSYIVSMPLILLACTY